MRQVHYSGKYTDIQSAIKPSVQATYMALFVSLSIMITISCLYYSRAAGVTGNVFYPVCPLLPAFHWHSDWSFHALHRSYSRKYTYFLQGCKRLLFCSAWTLPIDVHSCSFSNDNTVLFKAGVKPNLRNNNHSFHE